MPRLSPAEAKRLAELAMEDEDKTRDELVVEVQKLRAALHAKASQSRNRQKRISEMENHLTHANRVIRALHAELLKARGKTPAHNTERGIVTPIRRAV